jgi:hypothetical protein
MQLPQQRGWVRMYIDLDANLSDALNKHCKETGISKKFLMHKIVADYIESTKGNERGKAKK